MRISVADREAYRFNVYLDGKHMGLIVRADDEEGWVDQIAKDADGKLIYDGPSQPKVVRLTGKVRIDKMP